MNRRFLFSLAMVGLAVAVIGFVQTAGAQNQRNQLRDPNRTAAPRDTVPRETTRTQVKVSEELPANLAKVSDVSGMHVYGRDGEDLGKVHDLVVDLNGGCVRYAVLSFGGFLGIGDKYFAVPWQAMTLSRKDNDNRFVISVTTERLKTAPGFNKDKWPNFADEKFTSEVDKFYGMDRRQSGFRPGVRDNERQPARERDRTTNERNPSRTDNNPSLNKDNPKKANP